MLNPNKDEPLWAIGVGGVDDGLLLTPNYDAQDSFL